MGNDVRIYHEKNPVWESSSYLGKSARGSLSQDYTRALTGTNEAAGNDLSAMGFSSHQIATWTRTSCRPVWSFKTRVLLQTEGLLPRYQTTPPMNSKITQSSLTGMRGTRALSRALLRWHSSSPHAGGHLAQLFPGLPP